jgi:recombination protein RecA
VDLGVKLGVIDKAGAWFTVNGERVQGRDGVKDYLEANPEVCQNIEKQIIDSAAKLTQKAQREAKAAGKAVDISAEDFEG